MNKTKIEWCDYTWNPVTGCLHGCEYCYARRQAKRFEGFEPRCGGEKIPDGKGSYPGSIWNSTHGEQLHDFAKQPMIRREDKVCFNDNWQKTSYPYGFDPTFHRYRLDEPAKLKKPSNIFVCSMADLFGDWVPDEWIQGVFKATNCAPQHRYIYLTKNPDRYYQLGEGDGTIIPDDGVNGFFGASACTEEQAQSAWENSNCRWMSLEPIQGEFNEEFFWHDALVGDGMFDTVRRWDWIVVGAETGNRKDKILPKREWIENIVEQCRTADIPVFMKNNLAGIWDGELIREWPW